MGGEFDDDEIPDGAVCICRRGIVGVVTHRSQLCTGERCGLVTYYGRTLDDKPWQTYVPTKLADSLEEYQQQNGGEQ